MGKQEKHSKNRTGGNYENRGDVYLSSDFHVEFVNGEIVNYGALHLRTADLWNIKMDDLPIDNIYNSGIVYVDGITVLDRTRFANDQK